MCGFGCFCFALFLQLLILRAEVSRLEAGVAMTHRKGARQVVTGSCVGSTENRVSRVAERAVVAMNAVPGRPGSHGNVTEQTPWPSLVRMKDSEKEGVNKSWIS